MTNYEWLLSMPKPMLAQWLCDINKCDHCYFKSLKDEDYPGTCTWQWLNKECKFSQNCDNSDETNIS